MLDPYHIKTFFTWYNRFIDHAHINKNKESYRKKLDMVGKLVKGIDFSKNLLVICNKDIIKEFFLCGFMNLPTLRSFDIFNVVELMDIAMGSHGKDESSSRPEDTLYESIQDILNDVMCVTCNYYEAGFNQNVKTQDMLVNTIMRRYEYVERDKNKPIKVSWVFVYGTILDLDSKFGEVKKFFMSKQDSPLFEILDLNTCFTSGTVKEAPKKVVSSGTVENFSADSDF